jgi:hypothetical protein
MGVGIGRLRGTGTVGSGIRILSLQMKILKPKPPDTPRKRP